MKELQPIRVFSCKLKQVKGTHDIGPDECVRVHDGSVHMGFSGKMADSIYLIVIKETGHALPIAYVGFFKDVAPRKSLLNIGQILRIPGIGELIYVNHAP
jgi:hypothetical protein